MERDGYDTYLRPSVAFSTLGWFDDPLLSNLLRLEPARLAEVILHELLHNTIYLHGQAAFNESFANFVGSRGAVAFFALRGDPTAERRAAALWDDNLQFSQLLGDAIERLERAYASGIAPDERESLLRSLRADFDRQDWQTGRSPLREDVLNNAVLVHYRLYNDRLALFDRACERNGEDLRATITWVRTMAENQADAYAKLEMMLAPPADVAGSFGVETGLN
jgi:predicted aminopeptidase